MAAAVDKKGRCAVHPTAHAAQKVTLHFGRANVDCDRGTIAPEDGPPGIDHEERTFCHAFAAAIGLIEFGNLTFGFEIGQQGEVQVTSLRESCVAPNTVYGNAQKLRAVLSE